MIFNEESLATVV